MKNKILFFLIVFVFVFPFSVFAQANTACSKKGYTIATINGMYTDEKKAIENRDKLKKVLSPEIFNNEPINIDYLYNPSHIAGLGDVFAVTYQKLWDAETVQDYDLVEMWTDASEKVKTQKLLLVGHSQGNFYANGLYSAIANKVGGVPKKSIGVYGVATPSSYVAGGGQYITSNTDEVINELRWRNVLDILPANADVKLTSNDGNGHGFSNVYLKYHGDLVAADIKNSLQKLEPNKIQDPAKPCIALPEKTLTHKATGALLSVIDPRAIVLKETAANVYQESKLALRSVSNAVASLFDRNGAAAITFNNTSSGTQNVAVSTKKTSVNVDSKSKQQPKPVVKNKIVYTPFVPDPKLAAQATPKEQIAYIAIKEPPLKEIEKSRSGGRGSIGDSGGDDDVSDELGGEEEEEQEEENENENEEEGSEEEPEDQQEESDPEDEEEEEQEQSEGEDEQEDPEEEESEEEEPEEEENPAPVSNILYSQPVHSDKVNGNNVASFPVFTGKSGKIEGIKFAYNDEGNSEGHLIGLYVVDKTTSTNYSAAWDWDDSWHCSDVYESQGTGDKVFIELDAAVTYKAGLCDGEELVLNPTHYYGVALFRNHGGVDTQKFYGSSSNPNDLYLEITDDSVASTGKAIKKFNFPELDAVGIIDEEDHTINIEVPYGTDITALEPLIKISGDASIEPGINAILDFSDPVVYTVTAEDGSTQEYTVIVDIHSSVVYSQLNNSTEIINQDNIYLGSIISGAQGHIINLKFSYSDRGNFIGHFMGAQVVDETASKSYYATKSGLDCGSAYQSTGANRRVIVELDETYEYKSYPCTGDNLVLDPTHVYGIALFSNTGGLIGPRFYGESQYSEDAFLYIETDGLGANSGGSGPTMLSGEVTSVNTVDLTFSEDLNGQTITNADFSITGHTLTTPDAFEVTPGVVRLTISGTFTSNETPEVIYNTTVSNGVKDLDGNQVPAKTIIATQ